MKIHFSAPKKNYQAYIFDCDGTLADSMQAHFLSWNEAFKKSKAPFGFHEKLFHSMAGMTLFKTVEVLNEKFHTHLDPKEVVKMKEEIFHKELHLITAKEDVILFAKNLYEKKIPLAVASGGMRKSVLATLDVLKIRNLFNIILTQEDVKMGKPSPEIFLLASEKLKTPPSECLVFEDAPNGFKAAQEAKMDYVQVF